MFTDITDYVRKFVYVKEFDQLNNLELLGITCQRMKIIASLPKYHQQRWPSQKAKSQKLELTFMNWGRG